MNKVITVFSCLMAFILVVCALCIDLLIKKYRLSYMSGNSCAEEMISNNFMGWMCYFEWLTILLGVVVGSKVDVLKTNKLLKCLFYMLLALFVSLQLMIV